MDWGNAIVRTIERDATSGLVTALGVDLNLSGDFKKTKKKVTWLAGPKAPSSAADLVKCTLLDYDYLITKKKLEEDDSVEALLTPQTEFRCVPLSLSPSRRTARRPCVCAPSTDPSRSLDLAARSTSAVADHNVSSLAKGSIIQFERKGFYIVDRAFDASKPDEAVELILIPDGKASSIALKYQAPAAPAQDKDKKVKSGKSAAPAKDKVAAAAAQGKKAQPAKAKAQAQPQAKKGGKLPEVAPAEAVETVLLSEGEQGYEIPVKVRCLSSSSSPGSLVSVLKARAEALLSRPQTKMYGVPNLHADAASNVFVKHNMYDVPPINE